MATPGSSPPLSLRPFPVTDSKPKTLAEFISRVNAHPGGFRDVTEQKLRDDLLSKELKDGSQGFENNQMSEDDESMDDTSEGGDDDEESIKDPAQARFEVLGHIDVASNTAMLTLDFLSLLLSKQNPSHAGQTLSQQLRDMVGIGTVGADLLHEPNVTDTRIKDNAEISEGWTLMEINKTRDSAAEATRFLEKEVNAEGKYWEDVVAVQKAGWSICRVPTERHTLGVRFGFSEAAEFRTNGLAPMRRGDDGSVQLDIGRLGGVSARLLVAYEKDGVVVSQSSLPAQTDDDAPLEARVLEARNTIFSQELWHELTREARTLFAYNVRREGSRLICDIDESSRITLELATLGPAPSSQVDLDGNSIAEAISLSLHILLSHAHRSNELGRTRPIPPFISRPKGQQIHALLRPILARIMHQRNVRESTQYIGSLIKSLENAGLPASLTLNTPKIVLPDASTRGLNQASTAQSLVRSMLQALDFSYTINLFADITFTVRGRTHLSPVTATYYHVVLPSESPLGTICPPYSDIYPDLQSLAGYLRTAVARCVTEHFLAKLAQGHSNKVAWIQSLKGTAIRNIADEGQELRFAINEQDSKAVLVVTSTATEGKERKVRQQTWSSDDISEAKPLQGIVEQFSKRARL